MSIHEPMKPIPIAAGERIAKDYGYDQVIIIARRVGSEPDPCGEHVTTYGRNVEHCKVAAMTGNFLKHKVMGWPWMKHDATEPLYKALKRLHATAEDQRTRLGEELPETGSGRELFNQVEEALRLYEEGHS